MNKKTKILNKLPKQAIPSKRKQFTDPNVRLLSLSPPCQRCALLNTAPPVNIFQPWHTRQEAKLLFSEVHLFYAVDILLFKCQLISLHLFLESVQSFVEL